MNTATAKARPHETEEQVSTSKAIDEAKERGKDLQLNDRRAGKASPGRIVMYVLPNGSEVRPMIVVRVWNETGNVSGHVFHNGQEDVAHDAHGPFKQDVSYDPGKRAGTWHWPERT